MSAFLTNVQTFLGSVISWMVTAINTVIDSPALLVMVLAMPICGFAVGLLSRLVRL